MNETLMGGVLALALILFILPAAFLLKSPGKRKLKQKSRKPYPNQHRRTPSLKKAFPSAKRGPKKNAAINKKAAQDKLAIQVTALVTKHPQMVSQVLRQWMRNK